MFLPDVKNTGCNATGQCWNLTEGCVGKGHVLGSTQPRCWKNCTSAAGQSDEGRETFGSNLHEVKFTGFDQNLGQLQASNRDF